jgi:hypothetical protein
LGFFNKNFIHLSITFSFKDNFMVAWKRGIAVLSAGTMKVSPDPRIRLTNGYTLEIRDAVPQDAGDYICQIATFEPMEITHTVEILGNKKYSEKFRAILTHRCKCPQ